MKTLMLCLSGFFISIFTVSCGSSAIQSQSEPSGNVSTSVLNTVPPQGILQEVNYYGGLGGGSGCDNTDLQTPTFCAGINDDNAPFLSTIYIEIGGLPIVGENVKVKVELPNNISSNSDVNTVGYQGQLAQLEFQYFTGLDDPIGTYHFIFTGSNWSLDKYVNVSDSNFPGLIRNGNQLIFHKFHPNEKVRLFVYDVNALAEKANLLGWEDLQVDINGQLILNIDDPNRAYVAIGDASGQVGFIDRSGVEAWLGGNITR
jgi:hypothetical protein